MSDLITVQNRLSKLFGFEYPILFGRARSGEHALIKVLGVGEKLSVIIPSNVCPAMFSTPWVAQANVVLAPVNTFSGMPSDETYSNIVMNQTGSGIVMPTHLYGYRDLYPKTVSAARQKGWFVLENDTLAASTCEPAERDNASAPDAMLVSFGYSKTIDAGGGGAMFTDDRALAKELQKIANGFLPLEERDDQREVWLMNMRRVIRQMPAGSNLEMHLGEQLLSVDAQNISSSFPDRLIAPLMSALEHFPEAIESRESVAAIWNEELKSVAGHLATPPNRQYIPWRIIRTMDKYRDEVVAKLRANGIDAGTNFPPVRDSFPTHLHDQHHQDAETWGKHVVNLWVSPQYDLKRIRQSVNIIEETIQKYENLN